MGVRIVAMSMAGSLLLAPACSDSESASGQGGGPATSSTATTTTSNSGGSTALACQSTCSPPQFCSVTGQCIDEGTCAADEDCEPGHVCGESNECTIGSECGGQEASILAVPPNLLIVLDRSCSMTQMAGGQPKWTLAVGAIAKMTADFKTKIRFGLTLFPDVSAPSCDQDAAIPIPVSTDTEATIGSLLSAALAPNDKYFPDGPCVTNIDTAMKQAAGEPAFNDSDRTSYALLITDGKQSDCNLAGADAGTTQIITDLYQQKGVATFVLGFGGAVDADQMNTFAEAGGVPYSDPADPNTLFYKAEDQSSLQAALTSIASKTLGCVFALDETPPDSSKIYAFFNDEPNAVPRDPSHQDGWDYDASTNEITFYGDACEALKSGDVTDVDVVFGCEMPTPT